MEEQIPDPPEALPGDAAPGVTPVGDIEETIDTERQWLVWSFEDHLGWAMSNHPDYNTAKREYRKIKGPRLLTLVYDDE